jgi:hypothetical protein
MMAAFALHIGVMTEGIDIVTPFYCCLEGCVCLSVLSLIQ